MKPIPSLAFAKAMVLLYVFAPVLAQDHVYKPLTDKGCYSSSDPLKDQGPWDFQSSGYCQETCADAGYPVMGTKGANCWCGDLLPASSSKVPDSKCDTACQGFPDNICGGSDAWSIQLTGVDNAVGSIDNSGSSPSKSSSADFESKTSAPSATENSDSKPTQLPDNTRSAPPSVVTRASTVVVTAPGQTKASSPSSTQTSNSSNGPNKAGIAAGVVVGIIALCAFIGGLFFFLRNRKRRALEDEFHRTSANNAAVNAKPTSSSSMSDARLEPSVMMQRRQSDGSIADNQDYSRRILKVTNPDGS